MSRLIGKTLADAKKLLKNDEELRVICIDGVLQWVHMDYRPNRIDVAVITNATGDQIIVECRESE